MCFSHRARTLLLLFGIALGVAGVVAIDISGTSVGESFSLTTEAITGKATHRIVGSTLTLDQSLFTTLKVTAGIKHCAPVISQYVEVLELQARQMQLMGIDPFSETAFRSLSITPAETAAPPAQSLMARSGVLISQDLAEEYDLNPGDELTLLLGKRSVSIPLAGFLSTASSPWARQALTGILVADIATAQELLSMSNTISYIDLILKREKERQQILAKGFSAGLFSCAGATVFPALVIFNTHHTGPGLDFAGIFMVFTGSSLLVPQLTRWATGLMVQLPGPFRSLLSRMALKKIDRALSRTSVLIASLMVVTSVYMGIGTMTASFRHAVIQWIDNTIGGDIHVRAADKMAPSLDPAVVASVKALAGVEKLSVCTIHRALSPAGNTRRHGPSVWHPWISALP